MQLLEASRINRQFVCGFLLEFSAWLYIWCHRQVIHVFRFMFNDGMALPVVARRTGIAKTAPLDILTPTLLTFILSTFSMPLPIRKLLRYIILAVNSALVVRNKMVSGGQLNPKYNLINYRSPNSTFLVGTRRLRFRS
jgi:hypothetical protein